jgi:hypothetical protein
MNVKGGELLFINFNQDFRYALILRPTRQHSTAFYGLFERGFLL